MLPATGRCGTEARAGRRKAARSSFHGARVVGGSASTRRYSGGVARCFASGFEVLCLLFEVRTFRSEVLGKRFQVLGQRLRRAAPPPRGALPPC